MKMFEGMTNEEIQAFLADGTALLRNRKMSALKQAGEKLEEAYNEYKRLGGRLGINDSNLTVVTDDEECRIVDCSIDLEFSNGNPFINGELYTE